MSPRFIPLEIRPRFDPGMNWGVERAVLIRSGLKEVWWQRGHNFARIGPGGSIYCPANIKLVDWSRPSKRGGPLIEIIHEGRISRGAWTKLTARIAEWLGVSAAEVGAIDRKKTLVF